MCRIVAALACSPQRLAPYLLEAPRSLRTLSQEHKHGWGIATQQQQQWSLTRSTLSAFEDPNFDQACNALSHAWIAHIRLATVGHVTEENTHPFLRHRWCFAHNGTISDHNYLHENTSPARNAERVGNTDSELFLAYLLSRFDRNSALDENNTLALGAPGTRFDRELVRAVNDATKRTDFGAINFVLSDGQTMFIHRFGRTLWYRREPGVLLVASEPWDAEENGWISVSPGELLRADVERDTISLRSLSAET